MSAPSDLTEAFRYIGETMAELEATVLNGWPCEVFGQPTDEEAHDIESVHHEMSMQNPDLYDDECGGNDERCWYMAGQIVARLRRDLGERRLPKRDGQTLVEWIEAQPDRRVLYLSTSFDLGHPWRGVDGHQLVASLRSADRG